MRSLLLILLSVTCIACSSHADAQTPSTQSTGADLYASGQYGRARAQLLEEAAAGDAIAQWLLGDVYKNGRGVPPDYLAAEDWFRRSADQGFVPALSDLWAIRMLLWADENDSDEQELDPGMLEPLRQAAERGYPPAQMTLATILEDPTWGKTRPAESRYWLEQAAKGGIANAQRLLGDRLYRGLGGPKDEHAAALWMRRAADQGDAEAQGKLGVFYFGGAGVPEDPVEAYKWCNLAAANGYTLANQCKEVVGGFLSPSQLAIAQRLSATWVPNEPIPPAGPYIVEWRDRASRQPDTSKAAEPIAYRTGSAFFLASGILLTNAHVVDGCSAISIAGGPSLSLRAADPTADLALLNVPGAASHSVLYIRQGRGIRLGDDVVVAGFPLSGLLASSLNVTTGTISSLAGLGDDRTRIQITAPVQPGNSGGPLLDASGNVVGVVVSKLDALSVAGATGDIPQNVNFAISLGTLQAFLDANNIDYQTRNSSAAKSNADVAEIARAATVQVECKM